MKFEIHPAYRNCLQALHWAPLIAECRYPTQSVVTANRATVAPTYRGILLDVADKQEERKITVRNKSGQPAAYYLVNAGPTATEGNEAIQNNGGNGDLGQPWQCVYQASKKIASPQGSWTFGVESMFMALCGSGGKVLKEGVPCNVTDAANVELATTLADGTKLQMRLIPDNEAFFEKSVSLEKTFKVPGAFGIATSRFNYPNSGEHVVDTNLNIAEYKDRKPFCWIWRPRSQERR